MNWMMSLKKKREQLLELEPIQMMMKMGQEQEQMKSSSLPWLLQHRC